MTAPIAMTLELIDGRAIRLDRGCRAATVTQRPGQSELRLGLLDAVRRDCAKTLGGLFGMIDRGG